MANLGWKIVLLNIFAMFLVILAGWIARRRGYLNEHSTRHLSRFVVDFAMPAMVLTSLLRTIDPLRLAENMLFPVIGMAILMIGLGVGWVVSPLFCPKSQRSTFVFLVSIANWIYLPLPIAQQLYGDDGVRAVLLFNIGAQVTLWTVGVWTLRSGKPDWTSLRNLVTNPGMIATVAGIVIALLIPAARTLEGATLTHLSSLALIAKTGVTALVLLGALTIPLALVVTGAQLGGLDLSDHSSSRALSGVVIGRLLLTPAVVIALFLGVHHLGYSMPEHARMVAYLIASMPVAVSCSMFTDVFGGDTSLAARGIFYSSLFSLLTVPLLFFVIQWMHL